MKTVLSVLVGCLLVLAVPARATQTQASPAVQAGDAQQVALAIEKQQATVKQLQGDVEREESRSREADAKLKQQDQAIAELQQQLQAMKAVPQAAGR